MEGYWITHCEIGTIHTDGIAITHAGELFGGDPDHIWTGVIEEDGPRLRARIRIVPAVSCQEAAVMARERPMILQLSGYGTEEFARLEGYAEDRNDLRFEITMRKCKSPQFQTIEKKAA